MISVELVVYFCELCEFHEPAIISCFVPLSSDELQRLQIGDFIWLLRPLLRQDRTMSGIERTQICSLDRQSDGVLWVVLSNESFAIDPRRPDERILRLSHPIRLKRLLHTNPLAPAFITP